MMCREMKRPMFDRQVINVLAAIGRGEIRFRRLWNGSRRIDYTAKPGEIVSPYHMKWLVGAGLVQSRGTWMRPWVYRITPLGKKLLDVS